MILNVTYLTPLEYDAAAIGVLLSLVGACLITATLILRRDDMPLSALVADDPEVNPHAPMPRPELRRANLVRATSLPRALVSGTAIRARGCLVGMAWWGWRRIAGALSRDQGSDQVHAPAHEYHPLDDDLPPVQPLGAEPDWPELPADADVLDTMHELAEQERGTVPTHEPEDTPDPGQTAVARKAAGVATMPAADPGPGGDLSAQQPSSESGEPGAQAAARHPFRRFPAADEPLDSAGEAVSSNLITPVQVSEDPVSPAVQTPGEVAGCSAGADDTKPDPNPSPGSDVDDHPPLTEQQIAEVNALIAGKLDPARFGGVVTARAWVEQYLAADPWPVNA